VWTCDLAARIYADRETVFRLLAEIEFWPALFRDVRSARMLRRDGRRRLLAIQTSWYGLPIGWTAMQTINPDQGRMTLRHLSPLTRGSIITWDVRPAADADGQGSAVDLIVHQAVTVPLPVTGWLLAERFVGDRLRQTFGQTMLDRIKHIAEGGSLAGPNS
jgi:hypothetical protein